MGRKRTQGPRRGPLRTRRQMPFERQDAAYASLFAAGFSMDELAYLFRKPAETIELRLREFMRRP